MSCKYIRYLHSFLVEDLNARGYCPVMLQFTVGAIPLDVWSVVILKVFC